jgi:hypothetical protein
VNDKRYTICVADEQKHCWDADEFQRLLAAHRSEFDEKYKLLMTRLEKPFPSLEFTALGEQIDAHLKALQERVRNLPPRT